MELSEVVVVMTGKSFWLLVFTDSGINSSNKCVPINCIGSTTFPRLLLIFWPRVSQIMPWRRTLWNGNLSTISKDISIIRQTHNGTISWPVTSREEGNNSFNSCGQPPRDNGISELLNHVSRTSGSASSLLESRKGNCSIISSLEEPTYALVTLPSL